MKTAFVFLLFVLILNTTFAQKTTIHGKISSMRGSIISIGRPTKWLFYDTPKIGFIENKISKNGDFSIDLNKIDKEIIFFSIWDSLNSKRLFFQYFYISKGDNLFVFEDFDNQITISGKGEKHNHLKGIIDDYVYADRKQDTLPKRIFTIINDFYLKEKGIIESINSSQNTSSEFKNAWDYHLKYVRLASFFYNYGNIRLGNPVIKRNSEIWQKAFNSLQDSVSISDDNALVAPSYHEYLRTFLLRKHDELINEYRELPTLFYKEWFGNDSLKGKKAMVFDYTNQLKQKIIEKYFTGKVKEHMYALLFDSMINDQQFLNAKTIFIDFERQFPTSEFNYYFKKPLQDAISRFENKLTDKMLFLEGNTIANWDSISTHFKGKTVLLDMWGTWCSPCRQEINEHSAALKKHFEGKGLEFLYVANFDQNQEKWKSLIVYYKMEGSHIFANEDLTAEIMRKVKGSGYPTYAIIDKNGKVELSKAGFPMDREILIQQIEGVLKR